MWGRRDETVGGQEFLDIGKRVEKERCTGEGKRRYRADGHEGVDATGRIEARVWVAEETIQGERVLVTSSKTLQGTILLTESQPITEEGDAELRDDLRMETGERLADEQPADPVLPCRAHRINEQRTDLRSGDSGSR